MNDEMRNKLVKKIDALLSMHFEDEPGRRGPSWHQEPYKRDWFNLSKESVGLIHDEDLQKIIAAFDIQRKHALGDMAEHDKQILRRLVDAWGEWQYAIERLEG